MHNLVYTHTHAMEPTKTLHHLNPQTILNSTYSRYSKRLEFIAEAAAAATTTKDFTLHDVCSMQNLMDSQTLAAMGLFLVDRFAGQDVLIIGECLLPEWILLLFMDTYNLTRTQALNCIHLQQLAKIHSSSLESLVADAL